MTCGNDLNGVGRTCLPTIPAGQFLDAINNHGGYSTDKDAVTKVAEAGGFGNADIAAGIMQLITDDFSIVPRVALLEQGVQNAAAGIAAVDQQVASLMQQVAGLTQQVSSLTSQVAALTALVDRIAAIPSIANALNH